MEDARRKIELGQEIARLTGIVRLTADPEGLNPIHQEEYAKQFGLRGALVRGATLLACLLEMLLRFFGAKWLYHGRLKTSFIGGGAISGDMLTAAGRVTGKISVKNGARIELNVWLENQRQEKIVVGQASCVL